MENYEQTINVQITSPKLKNKSYLYASVASYEVRIVTSKVNLRKRGAASIRDIKSRRLSPSRAVTFNLRCLRLVNLGSLMLI